jgi:molecular chaperone HscA
MFKHSLQYPWKYADSAEILATLRHRAEDTFNDDLYGAVITAAAGLRPTTFPYFSRTANENGTRRCRKSLISLVGDTWIEHVTPAV